MVAAANPAATSAAHAAPSVTTRPAPTRAPIATVTSRPTAAAANRIGTRSALSCAQRSRHTSMPATPSAHPTITTATVSAVLAVTRTKWSEAYCANAVETFSTTGP